MLFCMTKKDYGLAPGQTEIVSKSVFTWQGVTCVCNYCTYGHVYQYMLLSHQMEKANISLHKCIIITHNIVA